MDKVLLTILLIATISYNSIAQQVEELKYKDVYKIVINGSDVRAYGSLLNYQKQDPYHPNTYYQLGVIAFNLAKEKDPLREYDDLFYFLYHSDLFFSLCLKYFDEKEAKKNWELYHHIKLPEGAKRIEYQELLSHINLLFDDVKTYKKNINFIRDNYFGAVRNYNSSLNTFKQIVDKNNKLKDIYLTADEELIKNIKNVGINFDSTIYYFDIYKNAIKDFPLKNYNQDYKLVPIEIYRLDGLTKSNFLKNDITLWNYKKWSDTVIMVIDNEINKLRFDIESEGKKIESLTNLMGISKDNSASFAYYELDVEFAYRVGRYDFQPLILDLLNYNVTRLNLIIDSKNPINSKANIGDSSVTVRKKLLFYKELVNKKIEADKQLKTVNNNLTAFNVLKYGSYINDYYKGEKGLRSYLGSETKTLEAILDESMENLKQSITVQLLNKQRNSRVLKNKNFEIPLAVIDYQLDKYNPGKYYTSSLSTNSKGEIFVTGFIAKTENTTAAFVAKSDSNFVIEWVKKIDFSIGKKSTLQNYGSAIDYTDDGCIAIVHTRDSIDGHLIINNWVVRYTKTGQEIARNAIGPALVPRIMQFDAINEKITVAYKGKQLIESTLYLDTLIVSYTDSIGNKIWETPLEIRGTMVNIIRSNENVILVGNYSKMVYNNTEHSVTDEKTNAFLAIFNNEGTITSLKKYNENFSYYLTHSVKLDSETLNLLGFKTEGKDYNKIQKNSDIKLQYMLINTNGNLIYKY